MFARGNWSAFKIDISSLEAFQQTLNNKFLLFEFSQLAAAAQTRTKLGDFNGINSFSLPRKDEEVTSPEILSNLVTVVMGDNTGERYLSIVDNETVDRGFSSSETEFRLTDSFPLYGLWFVMNEWKDVQDEASKKENVAYRELAKPFKLVDAKQKVSISAEVDANATMIRKQFPVLIDFVTGVVYAENTNKGALYSLKTILTDMGVTVIPTAWNFGSNSNWPAEFLNKVYGNSVYMSEFRSYAEESKKFNKAEVEEGAAEQDPMVERIVKQLFSLTELETEAWVGLASPALVSLSETSMPIAVKDVANTTLLLDTSDHTRIAGATIVIQELNTSTNKKGVEKVWRKDLASMAVSSEMNLVEAGVALLRGFDLPSFKKALKKDRSAIGVSTYWVKWLSEMNYGVLLITRAIAEALELPHKESGLQPMFEDSGTTVEGAIGAMKRILRDNNVSFELADVSE